jgi:hypothetical protein
VKIYVAAVEALRNKERGGQKRMKLTSPPQNNGAFLSFTPIERLLYFFAGFFFWESHTGLDQTQGSGAVFS